MTSRGGAKLIGKVLKWWLIVKGSGLLNNGVHDRGRWDLALARMGKPIEDFKWSFDEPKREAEAREDLRRRVKKFDPANPSSTSTTWSR